MFAKFFNQTRSVPLEPRSGSIFLAVGFNPRKKKTQQKNIVKYSFSLVLHRRAGEKDTETIRRAHTLRYNRRSRCFYPRKRTLERFLVLRHLSYKRLVILSVRWNSQTMLYNANIVSRRNVAFKS